jgi:hypothetical protein
MDVELACTHVASQAVAHYSYGHPLRYVEIGNDGSYVKAELLFDSKSWSCETAERAEQDIIATLAGPAGTALLLGRRDPVREQCDHDFVTGLCRQRGWNEAEMLEACRPRARDLVTAWMRAILWLAAELVRRGDARTHREDLLAVIEASSGRPRVPLKWS